MPEAFDPPLVTRALAIRAFLYAVPFYLECCLAMVRARRASMGHRRTAKQR